MTTNNEKTQGVGRKYRRQMLRQWKVEGQGLSLKQWAKETSQVGSIAQNWLERKKS